MYSIYIFCTRIPHTEPHCCKWILWNLLHVSQPKNGLRRLSRKLELACYPNQKSMQLFWEYSAWREQPRSLATPNSLLNQRPWINWLVNYVWYPGATQLCKASCASDIWLCVLIQHFMNVSADVYFIPFTIYSDTVIVFDYL